jgi:hypothetical protein
MLEQGKKIGRSKEAAEGGAHVGKFEFATAGASGDVEGDESAEAGAVHERDFLEIEDDALFFEDEGTNFVAKVRSVLKGEAAVTLDDHGLVGGAVGEEMKAAPRR